MSITLRRVNDLLTGAININKNDEENDNFHFYHFMLEHLIYEDTDIVDHLPVPVFSFIKPATGLQFTHDMFLSMGSFETEIDLIMRSTIREALRHAKLIVPSDAPEDLQIYSNKPLCSWIEDQLQHWSNSKRFIAEWIVLSGKLFDSVIVHNDLSMSDMPLVQSS